MKKRNKLYGAILGDLAGQPYEYIHKGNFSEFNIHDSESHITDDTLMTLATAAYVLGKFDSFEDAYKTIGLKYREDYFGNNFNRWLDSEKGTINTSYGNGCLMRVSPLMYLDNSLPLILDSVRPSHNHEMSYESVFKLFQAYKYGVHKANLNSPYEIVPFKKFVVNSKDTVDFCLNLCSQTYGTKRSITKAVLCGGDTDTNASIVGELSNKIWNDLTKEDTEYVESKLDAYLLDILLRFNKVFN
jgi:ADP-ribosylglycohydrolase